MKIVKQVRAAKTLEIGFAYGLSTLFICQALADNGGGNHTAIDPAQRTFWKSVGLANVKKAGFTDMVRFYEACSHEILPRLLAAGEQFDFVFIDGYHVFDAVLVDFYYSDRLIQPGSYIMFHDVWMPSVRKVVAFVLRNRSYKLARLFVTSREGLVPWLRRSLKELARHPFDLYSSWFLRQRYHVTRYVVVQKVRDDQRYWEHYRSF